MLSNPPFGVEWKKVEKTIRDEAKTVGFAGRFGAGLPRINDGSFLFLQHMIGKMKPGGSRIAIVFNGSPLFTGDAGSGESEIRRWIIENDWLEAVVALPDQLFYNTGISTYIWIVSNHKAKRRKGKIQLINAVAFYQKMRKSLGDKRNELSPQSIDDITRIYGDFSEGEHSKIFDNEDFGFRRIVVERPLRLNFQASPDRIELLKEQSAFEKLATSKRKGAGKEREIEEGQRLQAQIVEAVGTLDSERVYKDREAFSAALSGVLSERGIKVSTLVKKAILAALAERHETAKVCRDSRGNPEPATDLRDYESVPLKEDIHDYFKREVRPHVPDAWIDESKTKVGYEIPLTRHFYKYTQLRPLDEIEKEILELEDKIQGQARRGAVLTQTESAPSATLAVRRLFRVVNGSTPRSGEEKYWNGDITWVTPEDLGRLEGSVLAGSRRRITRAGLNSCGASLVPAGSLVLSTRAPIGHVARAGENLCTNQGCRSLVPIGDLEPRYYYYVIVASIDGLRALGQGTTFKELSKDALASFRIQATPKPAQRAIADFLDRKTAAIDDLIRKKERLIELLREKRQALITQAVTKGLDPDVPMKDSGIEWFGEIPAHWDTGQLKYLANVTYGMGGELDRTEMEGTPILSLPNVSIEGNLVLDDVPLRQLSLAERRRFLLRRGDLLFNWRSGSPSHIGKTAYFGLERDFTHVSFLLRLRFDPNRAEPRFYQMLLNGLRATGFFGASKFQVNKTYNQTELGRLAVMIPPLAEQQLIARHLADTTSNIDRLASAIASALERLREYRQALISAAVTGKVDVTAEARG